MVVAMVFLVLVVVIIVIVVAAVTLKPVVLAAIVHTTNCNSAFTLLQSHITITLGEQNISNYILE